jgi:Peptidase family M28
MGSGPAVGYAATASAQPEQETLSALDHLARLERPPASFGERAAAEWVASMLAERGARIRIEAERVHGTYWVPIGLSSAVAAFAALRRGLVPVALGSAAALSIADDLNVGRRPLRRVLRQRTAHNVLARIDPVRPDGSTLVVHAHHDAARTGLVFHPAGAMLMTRLAGGLVERVGATPAPMVGAVLGAAAVAAGGLVGSRWLRRTGGALSTGYAAAMANIAHSRTVPGANDNLSGVAVLLELAQALSAAPLTRLRVLLLSTGSEESFLEAMVRFAERHFAELPRERTTFLCVESVGSPRLMLLEGEGLLALRRYPRDLIDGLTELARERRVALREPFRYRLATDGQVPLLWGYPTAVISSMDWYQAPSNYHWPSDRSENLHLESIAGAATLARAFARKLDEEADGAE